MGCYGLFLLFLVHAQLVVITDVHIQSVWCRRVHAPLNCIYNRWARLQASGTEYDHASDFF